MRYLDILTLKHYALSVCSLFDLAALPRGSVLIFECLVLEMEGQEDCLYSFELVLPYK